MPTVCIVGTLDTKGPEFAFLKKRIEDAGCRAVVIDAGILGEPSFPPDIGREAVARAAGERLADLVARNDRGAAVNAMARGAAAIVAKLHGEKKIDGVVGLGGSAGTTIGTAAMRALPVGVPKLMVSTLAAGDTRGFVGTKDIALMYSVVDIAGINRISAKVLANAAGSIAGQVLAPPLAAASHKEIVAATMFGVTTPCVERARRSLPADRFEVLVFHATGTGGRAMEDLIRDGFVAGVLDITTTEWADEIGGGILSAGPDRLGAAAERGIPQVVSVGACDMVNFGPRETVPGQFRGRNLYVHNANVTLMRTTPGECRRIGAAIARMVSRARGPAAILLPLRGVSAIDKEGEVFYDPEADAALFDALREGMAGRPDIPVVSLDVHINDPSFGEEAARTLMKMLE
jgi:uncharacterized protein (UPF0261 family)